MSVTSVFIGDSDTIGRSEDNRFHDWISFYAGAMPVFLTPGGDSELSEVRTARYLAIERRVCNKLFPAVAAHPESYGLCGEVVLGQKAGNCANMLGCPTEGWKLWPTRKNLRLSW